jgi:hypothetical protein
MSCEKHKDHIEKYDGDIKQLARDIADLRYDTLEQFLKELKECIEVDLEKDSDGGRKKLANALFNTAIGIGLAEDSIKDAWNISKPFMPHVK